MKSVVYVLAMGHSGSTLLQRILATAQGAVGIGEAYQLVDARNRLIGQAPDLPCSCGAIARDCPAWGGLIEDLRQRTERTESERYMAVLERFFAGTVGADLIIDTSKALRGLRVIAGLPGIDLRVIHLIRDVRGWLLSSQQSYVRNDVATLSQNVARWGLVKGGGKYLMRCRLADLRRWAKETLDSRDYLRKNGIRSLEVAYEDLCLNTNDTVRRLGEFIGRPVSADLGRVNACLTHDLSGNRMRLNDVDALLYDRRWFHDSGWYLPLLCLPAVSRLNEEILASSARAARESRGKR